MLGVIDIALLGVIGSSIAPPLGVSLLVAALGLVTLAALIPARNGSRLALRTAVAARVISALLAFGAYVAGAPAWIMATESVRHRRDGHRARPAPPRTPAAGGLRMARLRFVLAGALLGLTWAASLRGYMMQIAGPDSTFTFSGTFGIILPSGTLTGALLGWAAYQHQAGRQYRLLIAAPLLLGVLPVAATGEPDLAAGHPGPGRDDRRLRSLRPRPALGPAGGRDSHRGRRLAPFCAPGQFPDLSATTPHGAWAATLGSSLFLAFALACSVPMRAVRQAGPSPLGRRRRTSAVSLTDRSSSGDSRQAELTVKMRPPRPSRTRLTRTGLSASGRTITSPTSTSSAGIKSST